MIRFEIKVNHFLVDVRVKCKRKKLFPSLSDSKGRVDPLQLLDRHHLAAKTRDDSLLTRIIIEFIVNKDVYSTFRGVCSRMFNVIVTQRR